MPGDVRTECKNVRFSSLFQKGASWRTPTDSLTPQALKEFATKETSRKRPARLTFYDAKGGAGVSNTAYISILRQLFEALGANCKMFQGSGISTKAFEFIDILLMRACDRVAACHCQVSISGFLRLIENVPENGTARLKV